MFPPTGGSYSVPDGADVRMIGEVDEERALAICSEYQTPADLKTRIDLATLLKVGCKARGEGDEMTATQLKVYADTLGRYPADIARKAVMRWMETETFFPALSELHDACKREVAMRNAVERAIRDKFKAMEDEANKAPRVDPARMDEIKRRIDAKYDGRG